MGPRTRAAIAVVALAFCGLRPLHATSFPPVTFDELIGRADVIFVGEVVDVHPYAISTRDGDAIKTRVVFRVDEPLFGTTSVQEAFDFLGGELNGERLTVAEMPAFAVGDRRMVFARRERSINPIVGFTQGLLRIDRDATGVDRVFTLGRMPLAQTETIGTLATPALMRATPMRLADFIAQVRRAVAGVRR